MRQVLAAVDVGFLDADLDPAFHPWPHPVGLAGLGDAGGAVDVQPDPLLVEVQEDHADVGVLQDVAERGHDAVAPVLGVAQGPVVQHLDKPGRAGPERAVALAAAVGGGDPDHLLAADEGHHRLVQPVEQLLTVEALGPVLGPVVALELALALGAGRLAPRGCG
jgi:hypothetical protein